MGGTSFTTKLYLVLLILYVLIFSHAGNLSQDFVYTWQVPREIVQQVGPALLAIDLGLISCILYGPPNPTRNDLWAEPREPMPVVAPKQKPKPKNWQENMHSKCFIPEIYSTPDFVNVNDYIGMNISIALGT